MGVNSSASEIVATHFKEVVKTFSIFDGSDRLEFFYVAHADAEDGDLCMVTQYAYVGATTKVEKTKESKATWDGSWEI